MFLTTVFRKRKICCKNFDIEQGNIIFLQLNRSECLINNPLICPFGIEYLVAQFFVPEIVWKIFIHTLVTRLDTRGARSVFFLHAFPFLLEKGNFILNKFTKDVCIPQS